MSEKLFKFLLSELKLIRIRCKNDGCGAVVERPLCNFSDGKVYDCPVCGKRLLAPPDPNAPVFTLKNLADIVTYLSDPKHKSEIEFVLPNQE